MVVPFPSLHQVARQWLVLWHDRPLRPETATLLHARAGLLAAHAGMDRWRQAEALRRQMFDRAMSTAQMGLWTCLLPGNDLSWSNGVYDLFELPRGSAIERATILDLYEPESRREMEYLRSQALASGGDFAFDAAITTARGRHRWIRITASAERLEGGAARLFGVKQDITTEKLMAEHTRQLAETDALTGLANRSLFQRQLAELVARGGANAALLLVDLDHFKTINDAMGHAQGDSCLMEAATRLRRGCPDDALVAGSAGTSSPFCCPMRPTARRRRWRPNWSRPSASPSCWVAGICGSAARWASPRRAGIRAKRSTTMPTPRFTPPSPPAATPGARPARPDRGVQAAVSLMGHTAYVRSIRWVTLPAAGR